MRGGQRRNANTVQRKHHRNRNRNRFLAGPAPRRLLQVIDVGRKLGRALTAAVAAAAEAAAAAAAGPKVISSRPAWKAAMGLQRQVGPLPYLTMQRFAGGGLLDFHETGGHLAARVLRRAKRWAD